MEHQQIVHTVIDPAGAYAFMADETAALQYAARVHGKLGPIMTAAQAHELVEQTNHNDALHSDSEKLSDGDATC